MSLLSRLFGLNGHAPPVPYRRGPGATPQTERNNAIRAEYRAGISSQAIADKYGLSRERICQLLRPYALPEIKQEKRREAKRVIAEEREMIRAEFEALVLRGIELVREGKSIDEASRQLALPRGILGRRCLLLGVTSDWGRHRSRPEREARLRALCAAGHSASHAVKIMQAEGERIHYTWVKNHCPDLIGPIGRKKKSL